MQVGVGKKCIAQEVPWKDEHIALTRFGRGVATFWSSDTFFGSLRVSWAVHALY